MTLADHVPPSLRAIIGWVRLAVKTPSDPDEVLVEAERVRSVFQQAAITLLVTVINATLTAIVLAPIIGYALPLIWAALNALVSAGRWALRQLFLRRCPPGAQSQPWAVISILSSLTTGTLWGAGAAVMFPASETYQLFLAFVIGGMCAGTTTVNSAHMPSVLAFILPATLPLSASFLVKGSAPQLVSALMILVFAVALSLITWRAHCAFGKHIRLELALERQGRALSAANEQLRREMAERRNVEATLQQAQKMEAIGHLTGGIAHDFNNLLQVVIGNLSLLRRSTQDARVLRYALSAEGAAQKGAQLINSLLAFARRQSLSVERVNLNALLREFQPILLQALDDRIKLQLMLDPELPACLTDPAHFQSVILNLVINARDAMPGGGQLSITTGATTLRDEDLVGNSDAKPGRFVTVTVEDSGFGMTKETMARVFEPFFTTKEVGKGSGLGLSQVYGFARQSGGHVRLRSAPKVGTSATLYLPTSQ